ncbi:peptidase family M48-domain-containing protein [Collybia nuda]|uniref:Peptidase family M48-domain-containing protein n=1 Tax=Collybia nuda TaxID=64659 RepID=A0A9P5YF15_9AGAR|nr:peptidase family M48-domain-containing protein [Collybia nuda]
MLGVAAFHSTPRKQGGPLIPLFAAMLKASTSLEIARTAGRIALTFMPVILLTNRKSQIGMKIAALKGNPPSEESKTELLRKIRNRKVFLYILLLVPATLFWATIIASLEKTPLTGRWRMIILSPEEEEEIAAQLAGPGWYNAVGEILAQDGSPRIIPTTDWRYAWVNHVLRRLEATIPVLTNEPKMYPQWSEDHQDIPPMPPPAEYPLRPRPRASEYLRWFCESICERKVQPMPHAIPGPPYSLLVVDNPGASNAFSYGFGPDGGGGIVVYSGFLDDVLSRIPPPETVLSSHKEERSWWSKLLGNIFSTPLPPPSHPIPTAAQTTELAILLAHELSHLILSHHLESLSSATVIIPGTISILADVLRVLIFPVTMLFGPFVNDAVAQLGKVGSGELIKVGEYCTSMKQEIEADVVSARLLAHAGFDAREAVKFWEIRSGTISECSRSDSIEDPTKRSSENLARRIMGSTHPVNEIRVDCLKNELARWETERRSVVSRVQSGSQEAAPET